MKKKLLRKVESDSGKILAVDCIEESFHVLRLNAWALLPIYCFGTIPFVLGMIYFVNDMCQHSDASQVLPSYAFYMAGLYLWKNIFQSWYCRAVMEKLTLQQPQKIKIHDCLRIILYQGVIQPFALFAYVITSPLLVLQPFAASFFNTFTVLSATGKKGFFQTIHGTAKIALLYPLQNALIFYMLLILGVMAGLNIAILIFFIPWILKTFMGINTVYSSCNSLELLVNLIFNSTFWSIVAGTAYLLVDPLVKTAYTIRIFYAESMFKGYDILASLQQIKKIPALAQMGLIIFMTVMCFPANLPAADQANPQANSGIDSPQQLDNKIKEVLQRREYSWRLPPELKQNDEPNAVMLFFDSLFETIGNWIDKIRKFMEKFFNKPEQNGGSALANLGLWIEANAVLLSIILLAVILVCVLIIVLRRRRNAIKTEAVPDIIPDEVPDLNDENVTADVLDNSEWLRMAADLIARGELKLAIRALFLASLALLADQNALTIAKYKTNLDYLKELKRRHHTKNQAIQAFSSNLYVFEKIWYGDYEVNQSTLTIFRENFDIIQEDDGKEQ